VSNPHIGSSFASFLDALGIRAEVEAIARAKMKRAELVRVLRERVRMRVTEWRDRAVGRRPRR
jgi:hypothetical protein